MKDYTLLAIPAFVALMLLELAMSASRRVRGYEVKDTFASLAMGVGNRLIYAAIGGALVVLQMWLYEHRLIDLPWAWWVWVLCFFAEDLAYYCFHRGSHEVRLLWAAHENHHSSQRYNLSTALRQSWTTPFTTLLFYWPLPLLGFHPAMVFFVGGLNLIYQFWIHTEAIDRLPRWFEAVMNTPSHHRVHHATNPRYLDANYAGVFIIWDRMFGSFTPEVDDEPIRYGIVKQLGTFNLLWSVFHEWIGIAKDLWAAPFGAKLGYLFGPPGWSHDGSRDTSDTIKQRWQEQQGG